VSGAASVAAVGLAGGLGVGLAGAFAAAGVGAALMNKNVRKEFKDLGTGMKNQIAADAKPVADTMLGLAKYVNSSLKTMRPALQGLFRDIAPLVDVFGKGLVGAVSNVVGEFQPLIKLVLPIVRSTFAALPDLIGNLSLGLQAIVKPLSQNTSGWSGLLGIVGSLLPVVGSILGSLVKAGTTIMPALAGALGVVGKALDSGLAKLLPIVADAISAMLPSLGKFVSALAGGLGTVLGAAVPVLARIVPLLANALAPVLPTLATGFADLVKAAGKILPVLVPLAGPLVLIVKGVGNLIGPLASVAATMATALAPALKVVGPLLGTVAGTVGTALADAFRQASPALASLARSVGQMLIALVPLVPVIVKTALSFVPLIPAVAQLAASMANALVPAMQFLGDHAKVVGPALLYAYVAVKAWTAGAAIAGVATSTFAAVQKGLAAVCLGTRIQLIALQVQTVAVAVAQGVAAVASKVWAGAQWLLNAALDANPISIVVIAVAALAGGLYLAYKHSATFRRIVNDAFHAVAAAGKWMWEVVLRPALFALATGFLTVAGTIVHGAALAFGWIPGIGPKLKGAAHAFDVFKNNVLGALDGIPDSKTVKFYPIDAGLLAYVSKVKSTIGSIPNQIGAGIVHGPFQHGSWSTPGGLALIHPGEMIIPAAPAERIRRGYGGFGGGGVVNHYTVNVTVNGVIATDKRKFADEIIPEIRRALRATLRSEGRWTSDGKIAL
jgi:hypothetical protein